MQIPEVPVLLGAVLGLALASWGVNILTAMAPGNIGGLSDVTINGWVLAFTLGAGLIMAAVAIHFMEVGITLRAAAAIFFLLLTAPVAAHLIGRAFYHSGESLSDRTWIDELRSQKGKNN